jgi:hypothetical protein
MLWDVGEPLLGWQKRGLTHQAGSHAGGAADALANEVRRGSPNHHCSIDEGGCYLQGSPGETCDRGHGRGATVLAAAEATIPPGAATMAVEGLAPNGSMAAVAASAIRVFLLQLPGGGRVSEGPAASPPGPWPYLGPRAGSCACARPTRQLLRLQLCQQP